MTFDDLFGSPSSAYTHNGDKELLEALWFKTDGFEREWTYLGTHICPNGNEIHAEVCAMPAQFFKFVISTDFDRYTLETGSGGFSKYWHMAFLYAMRPEIAPNHPEVAEALASDMLIVTKESR